MKQNYLINYPSPLGRITLASNGDALTGLWFEGQTYFAAGLPAEVEYRELPLFVETRVWLDRYFAGEDAGAIPRVHLSGTPF